MKATYRKLRDGSWGIRVEGAASVGATVSVTKRDGSAKSETISRVLWTGQGISLCSIGGGNGHSSRSSSSSSSAPGKCACGDTLSEWERRHGVRRCANCRDGGGNAHGGQSYYDRHGNFVLGDDD